MIEIKVTSTKEQFRAIMSNKEVRVVGLRLSPVDTLFFSRVKIFGGSIECNVRETVIAETQETLSKTLRTTMCRYDDEVIDWLWGHIVEYKKFVSKSQYTK